MWAALFFTPTEVDVMTGEQKQKIQDMRLQGSSYGLIAGSLGLSVNTVKSFFRRNNLTACDASNDTGIEDKSEDKCEENKEICKQCGKRLEQTTKAKPKTFCCDKCRFDWWNINRDKAKRKPIHQLACACCGTVFNSHDINRKYCRHACYIAARFGRGLVDGKGARRDKRAV